MTERVRFRKALRDGPPFEIEREADAKTYYFFAMGTTKKLPEAALCEIRNHQHQSRNVTNEGVPSVMRMRKVLHAGINGQESMIKLMAKGIPMKLI